MKKIYSFFILVLLPMLASAATGNDKFKFADITAVAGGEATLAIEMDNEDELLGMWTALKLPDGVSVNLEKLESASSNNATYYFTQINEDRTPHANEDINYYTVIYRPSVQRCEVISWTGKPIKGNTGVIFYVPLIIGSGVKDGFYDITLTDIQFSPLDKSGVIYQDDFTGKLIVGNPATNSITATDITAKAGKTFAFPINLDNTDEITEAEFKLALPEGISLESAAVTGRGNGHEIDYKLRAGKYNFEVFSEKGTAFSGTEGAFVELILKADASVAPGDYNIQVSDITLITADNKEVSVNDFTAKLTIEEPTSSISAANIEGKAGKNIALPINLENDNEITEIDFKLTLPAEVTLEGAAVTDRGTDHEVDYKLRSGSYKFEITSPTGSAFTGTEGAFVELTLKTDKTTAGGEYTLQISDITLVTSTFKEITVKDFAVKLSLTEYKEITVEDITNLIQEYLEQ